jgi:hypothetical protein
MSLNHCFCFGWRYKYCDDSVKDARSGDWVKITGIFNIITKANPTATTDFISLNAITTWESITGKPAEITDTQVTSGVGTDPVLVTPAKAKAMIEAHSTADSCTATTPSVVTSYCGKSLAVVCNIY